MGATAATTVLGAFDPFEDIAAVCQQHGVWMHVDGCWGAAALLSPRQRHIMKGAEKADSVAWNPHKLMGLPLQCSAFLTRHKGVLSSARKFCTCTLLNGDSSCLVWYTTCLLLLCLPRQLYARSILTARTLNHPSSLSITLCKQVVSVGYRCKPIFSCWGCGSSNVITCTGA